MTKSKLDKKSIKKSIKKAPKVIKTAKKLR